MTKLAGRNVTQSSFAKLARIEDFLSQYEADSRKSFTESTDRVSIAADTTGRSRQELTQAGKTFADEQDEQIELTMLRSDEPGLKNEEVSYRLPRKARVCPEGMEGIW